MTPERALLAIYAAAFAFVGGWALLDPVGLLAGVEVRPTGTGGVVELRAMYGGLELGLAAFLALCLRDPAWVRAGIAAGALTVGCLGAVRGVGLLLAPSDVTLLYAFVPLEVGGGLAGAFALLRRRAPRSSETP